MHSPFSVPLALAAAALLLLPASAGAHAVVGPPIVQSGTSQVFTLAVPTETEGATTTTIRLEVPDGFAIDSFEDVPGWTREVKATGSGEEAVVQEVTWSGGKTPTGSDSMFRFLASPAADETYRFVVHQTYSDGSVVDWAGAEDSDAPAPTVIAVAHIGGGGESRTLSIIALIVGGLGLLLGIIALAGGRGRRPVA